MYPRPIQNAIDEFKKLPGIGPKHAARCVFSLLKDEPRSVLNTIRAALNDMEANVYRCPQCFAVFEKEKGDIPGRCTICRDPRRTNTKMCVITTEIDLWSIEDAGLYDGTYFVLGENITLPNSIHETKNRINDLYQRIEMGKREVQELIIATDHDLGGDTTFRYIKERFKNIPQIKITRLGRGIPRGGEIAYTDEETLKSAFEGRS